MPNNQQIQSISAFVPCFNEEKNIKPMVEALTKVLFELTPTYEIIIINDGSKDDTGKVANSLAHSDSRLKVIHHPSNLGYGASLRSGINAARYEWTFFTDGDCQFNVGELNKFIPWTNQYNVIIGYRIKRIEGGVRALNARLFKSFIDILFRVHVKDIDCAFKLIKTDILQSIELNSTGAMISSELLYRLKKRHEPFKQLPVTHYPRTWGKPTGSNFKVIIRAGYEALKLYLQMKLSTRV